MWMLRHWLFGGKGASPLHHPQCVSGVYFIDSERLKSKVETGERRNCTQNVKKTYFFIYRCNNMNTWQRFFKRNGRRFPLKTSLYWGNTYVEPTKWKHSSFIRRTKYNKNQKKNLQRERGREQERHIQQQENHTTLHSSARRGRSIWCSRIWLTPDWKSFLKSLQKFQYNQIFPLTRNF